VRSQSTLEGQMSPTWHEGNLFHVLDVILTVHRR